ncbi:MIF4G-domain-containing protein [Lophium mytilinum]|uniref:Pre-mRNA-splicing factor CWC22 n=1 Tax=Lophium mytilinum TaxID=390894 RepID=A0A6A6Q7Q1_9PEZI|nr:MIF4G-domain-containing protein [Lophium mytilinum]
MEIASAVRVPSPEPAPLPRKRDRSPAEAGPSKRPRPTSSRNDDDGAVQAPERERGTRPPPPREDDDARFRQLQEAMTFRRKPAIDDSKTRAGGAYIPPARLRALQAAFTDKSGPEFQRMAWEALKKSIQGMINKCNTANIKQIVPELFAENLVRGRGLFCKAIMKAQAASLPFTPIYAAMVAIVNTKLPQVGDLLCRRLIIQFRKSFRRNDKAVAVASSTFMAHLVNQQVLDILVIAQVLLLLLSKPTDDSVEIAVGITREVGHFLEEMNGKIANTIFEQFRNILHEAGIEKRTQYQIEVLFQVRKDKYKDNPSVKEDLDLVEEEDLITHRPGSLDDMALTTEDTLNIFKYDPDYVENEAQYRKLRAEILGEAGSDDEDGYTDATDSEDDEGQQEDREIEINDRTNADLVNLRRTIYLTIKSSSGFEECCHKLMRVKLPPGLENEMTSMIIECASQERTYEKFYGHIGERFCKLNRMWTDLFESDFAKYYDTIHRFENNRLRIIAQFFAHLLASDALGWHVLSVVHLNEEDTTSSSRIFIKILFEELIQAMGQKTLVAKLQEDFLQPSLAGIFPTDSPTNARFAINFFTAINMGVFTEGMRNYLKNDAPKPAPLPAVEDSDSESVSSYSSYSSRSRSRTRSRSPRRRLASRSLSSRSPSRSVSPRRNRRYSSSPSRFPSPPTRHRGRSLTMSRSPTPPPRHRGRRHTSSPSRSPSPPPRHRDRSLSDSLPPRRHARSISDSPPRHRRARSPTSPHRQRSPPRRHYSSSRSRSPLPDRRRRESAYSRSRSPPRRRAGQSSPPRRRRPGTPSPQRGGRRARRDSTPPPPRNRRNTSSVSAAAPPPTRRRNSSSVRGSPPPPKREN